MKQKNNFLNKIKFFFLVFLFLSLVGAVLGLSIAVFMEQQKEFLETSIQEDIIEEENQINKDDELKPNEILSLKKNQNFYVENILNTDLFDENQATFSFKIGEDIPPGVYMISPISDTIGYYRITSSSDPALINIIENDIFSEITYVQVNSGEYLTLISSELTPFEDINPSNLNIESVLNGKFLVGKDIPPGEYSIFPYINYGYVEVTNNLRGAQEDTLKKSYFDKPLKIVLSEGQFIRISAAYLRK